MNSRMFCRSHVFVILENSRKFTQIDETLSLTISDYSKETSIRKYAMDRESYHNERPCACIPF